MRIRPARVLPLLAYGLAIAMGCAGAGSPTVTGAAGKGGASATGTAGTAGTSSSGAAGTVGNAGTTGSAGSVSPGQGGISGTTGVAGNAPAGTGGVSSTAGTGGVSSTAGTTGSGGTGIVSGAAGTTGAAGTGGVCQTAQYTFDPKIPIVYLLVDRSGSMFHCLTGATGDVICMDQANTAWSRLKEAVRSVVKPLEGDVQFGFATIWGTNPASPPGTCPSLQGMTTDNVNPALNNANAIMAKYDSLLFPPNSTQQGVKFESPASESIQVVAAALKANASQGDKYIIFITDGQPDYCDDSNSLCAPDSVVGRIQEAKTNGVTTIVLGIQTALFDLGTGILKAYATAGAGEPTVAPLRGTGTINDFYDQCNGLTGWHADMVALGKANARGTTIGTYMTTAGPTNPYMPSATDQTMLVTQLSQALAGVKSCTFDLSDVGGKSIKVDVTKLNQATVKIEGKAVPLDPTNGWNVAAATPTQLVLTGTACTTWKMPGNNNIDFQFPCGSIIFE